MTTQEERISRLEGAYEHLATKADVEEVKVMIADLRADMADQNAKQNAAFADLRADMADQNAKQNAAVAELRADMADQNAKQNAAFAELRAEMANQRATIADLRAELTWRVAGLQLAGLAAVAAIMGFLR